MAVVWKPNHVETALANVLSHLADAENYQTLVEILVGEVQPLEDTAFSLVADRMLDSAIGAQLDQWGKIVGEPRDGLADSQYRKVVLAKIQANRSSGVIPVIISVFAQLSDALGVRYDPLYPAAYQLAALVGDIDPVMSARTAQLLRDMRPAGVELSYASETTPGYFGFSEDDEALGFDDGAFLTELIYDGTD